MDQRGCGNIICNKGPLWLFQKFGFPFMFTIILCPRLTGFSLYCFMRFFCFPVLTNLRRLLFLFFFLLAAENGLFWMGWMAYGLGS